MTAKRRAAQASRREVLVDDSGMAMLEFIVAVVVSLSVLLFATNLVMYQYGKAVLRQALHSAVDAGRAHDAGSAAARCQQRANDAINDLTGGSMVRNVTIVCSESANTVTGTVSARFQPLVPGVGAFDFQVTATSTRERPPG